MPAIVTLYKCYLSPYNHSCSFDGDDISGDIVARSSMIECEIMNREITHINAIFARVTTLSRGTFHPGAEQYGTEQFTLPFRMVGTVLDYQCKRLVSSQKIDKIHLVTLDGLFRYLYLLWRNFCAVRFPMISH